ncbi:rhomboid family intramembrane serine protease [Mucilaginibacter sp. X4EP1]|uniref:rhomboid family intramembrane serine protease n=1 Tax=Mucilaginibacter sp. X4EP1 TaxID=2723092 RepID=UPI0021688460|nr:rhomboid family intramembrane serine protease [Mucilaginibacter sp. X4EP1]MCS3811840.1 rhomboid-like protein [Mucilaginibacter sp. X4EP1]
MSAYRQSPFANLTPVVKNLLIINLICFIPFLFIDHQDPRGPVTTFLGGFYFNSPNFKPWQPITYMFMHGGWEHILFNMFALFSFGPILEYAIGGKRFFNLYFICGIGAYVLQMVVQGIEIHGITGSFTIAQPLLDSTYFQYGDQAQKLHDIYFGPLVGASGAIFGVLVAFGMLYPNLELMILFVPVPIKAKYIIPIYIIIEIVLGVGQFGGDNVAHFAHLGGALLGFILVKTWRLR